MAQSFAFPDLFPISLAFLRFYHAPSRPSYRRGWTKTVQPESSFLGCFSTLPQCPDYPDFRAQDLFAGKNDGVKGLIQGSAGHNVFGKSTQKPFQSLFTRLMNRESFEVVAILPEPCA